MNGFPSDLYDMLMRADPSVVSWQPNGCSFMIRDMDRFVQNVSPRHCGHSKLHVFQKQLNDHAFTQIASGRDQGAYFHQLFLRERSKLILNMNARQGSGASAGMVSTSSDLLGLEHTILSREGPGTSMLGSSIEKHVLQGSMTASGRGAVNRIHKPPPVAGAVMVSTRPKTAPNQPAVGPLPPPVGFPTTSIKTKCCKSKQAVSRKMQALPRAPKCGPFGCQEG